MGIVSVFGKNVDTCYDKLLEGKSGIAPIDRFDASSFSVRFAGEIRNFSSEGYIDGKSDRRLDDCWRYSMVAGRKALDDANLGPEALKHMDRSRIGIIVGSGIGGMTVFTNGVNTLIEKGYKKTTHFSPRTLSPTWVGVVSDRYGPNGTKLLHLDRLCDCKLLF